jgi:transposase
MLSLTPAVRIYLASEPVDMRKGFDGLMAIVRAQRVGDVFSGHLFVFLSRRADRLKALYWDRGGFVLLYKRLESGRFKRPEVAPGASSVVLGASDLAMLLDGIDLRRVRRPRLWEPPAPGRDE